MINRLRITPYYGSSTLAQAFGERVGEGIECVRDANDTSLLGE